MRGQPRLPAELKARGARLGAVLLLHAALGLLLLRLAPEIVPAKVTDMVMISLPNVSKAPEPEPETETSPEPPASPRPQPPAPQAPRPQPAPEPPPPLLLPTPAPEAPPPAPAPPQPARPDPSLPVFGPPDLRPRPQPDSERVEGSGPNGEPLYAARWVREPYDDELRGFLSTAQGPGWGLIACRTAPGNRVEDCVILGESPPGSGIARAVQAAAWQFLVHPPRIGGRPQVGEWVRIRIDYTRNPR